MPRRVSLPGADELFRTTGGAGLTPRQPGPNGDGSGPAPAVGTAAPDAVGTPGASGVPGGPGNGHVRAVPAPSAGPDAEAEAAGAGNSGGDGTVSASAAAAAAADAMSAQAQEARTTERTVPPPAQARDAAAARPAPRRGRVQRRPSGRERHDEKITVYVSAEELMDLEHARLTLRGDFGLAVDRGRIVREAIAVVLADLEARGEASILVRRLRGGGPGH
ncbi:hypothetical protein ACPA54_38880 [Uniformispora flossi]|uniref:hypothetical protein n=1 Tax=Uniformispora flossi TaxID=3390723 RepID=UPI003C2F3994